MDGVLGYLELTQFEILKIKSYVFPYFKIQFLILIKYNHQSFYHLNKVDTKFPI